MKKLKHFLSITDLSKNDLMKVLDLAIKLKGTPLLKQSILLKNKTMAMIFEKPSLRTRVSFEVGMTQLGGHAIYLSPSDIGLGIREPIKDVSRVLSRMVDIIMARTFLHTSIVELARYSDVPVINALSDLEHPCQILADLLMILEKKGKLKSLKASFVGDGENNVTHSLALASGILGINFSVAAPKGFWMDKGVSQRASELAKDNGGEIIQTLDPAEAVNEADVVYTDTWVSMGDESETAKRLKIFKGYQVTTKLMQLAKKDAIFMHDMPVYRNKEVAQDVIDGPHSVVIDQAENRLHAQKALICYLLDTKIR